MKKQHKNDWRHKKCKMVVHKKCEKDDDGDQKCRPTIMCVGYKSNWDCNPTTLLIKLATRFKVSCCKASEWWIWS